LIYLGEELGPKSERDETKQQAKHRKPLALFLTIDLDLAQGFVAME
jgi:hypothetical protein